MTASAWPRCTRCTADGHDTPARWTVTAGNTAAMRELVEPACDRHLDPARTAAIRQRWRYREVRAAEPGDGAVAADDEQQALF